MYEAVRQRAPNSTKLAGAGAAMMMTAAIGYVLMTGFPEIAKAIQGPIVFTPLPDVVEPPPTEKPPLEITVDVQPLKSLAPDDIAYTIEDPPITAPPGLPGPSAFVDPGPAKTTVAFVPAPVRIAPRIRPADPPPYPPAAVRAGEHGLTGLDVCVDARGRVTSATLAASSGSARLDEAALKWVRNARFTPGTLDGTAQSVCGHRVAYEWNLRDAQK